MVTLWVIIASGRHMRCGPIRRPNPDLLTFWALGRAKGWSYWRSSYSGPRWVKERSRGGSQKAPVTVVCPRPAQKPPRCAQEPFQVRKFASKNGILTDGSGINREFLVQDPFTRHNPQKSETFETWGPVVIARPKVVPRPTNVHTPK